MVEFHRQGPLVQHQIAMATPQRTNRWLTTWQADPIGDWPASPPLQSCQSMEDPQGRPVVLATGLAGRSHWSLSVSVSEAGGLLFDVACRTGAAAAFLGSTYQVAQPAGVEQAGELERQGTVEMSWSGSRAVLRPAEGAGGLVRLNEAGRLVVAPASLPTESGITVRWAYEVRFQPT